MAPKTKGPPPRDRTCGNCLHFKPEADEPSIGECRLFPPSVVSDPEDGPTAIWPVVSAAEDYCGQHVGNQ